MIGVAIAKQSHCVEESGDVEGKKFVKCFSGRS